MATEEFIDATIATLKIIGMVPKNGKLCIRKGQLCLDTGIKAQGLWRFFNGDSRDMTLIHAKNTINNAVKINRSLMLLTGQDDMVLWTLHMMLTEMENCEGGLLNLKSTYINDSMILANLDVLVERQRAHIEEVRKFIDKER
jgi:hypothetical protein